MRRILLAVFAVLLLHAAPAMATECQNLALPANGGTATASSNYGGSWDLSRLASASSVHSSAYPVTGVNNGRRESGSSRGYWNDGTNGVWPDWAAVEWDQPVAINRIVALIPLARPGFPLGEITLGRTRIQYWDDATSTWVDVVGETGQANPILDWTGPVDTYDGSEARTFDFDPVATTRIRALIEEGTSDGWSWLDELEAYCDDCVTPTDVNLSLAANGGIASASSRFNSNYAPRALNDGVRQTSEDYYWNDGTRYTWPDWAQIGWDVQRTLNRVVVRGPAWVDNDPVGYRTQSMRVQWWDAANSAWVDVVSNSGQDNPILNWLLPVGADGSEIRQLDFDPVRTDKIRVLIEAGSTIDGWSFLDEIETYWIP